MTSTTDSFNPSLPSDCPWKLVRIDEGNGNFKYKLVPASENDSTTTPPPPSFTNKSVVLPTPAVARTPTAPVSPPKSLFSIPQLSLHSKLRVGAPTRSDVSRKTYTKTSYSPTRQATQAPPSASGKVVATPAYEVSPQRIAAASSSPVQTIPGPQGLQGVQGVQGERGEQGPQGEKGEKGDEGVAGKDGASAGVAVTVSKVVTVTEETQISSKSYTPVTELDFSTLKSLQTDALVNYHQRFLHTLSFFLYSKESENLIVHLEVHYKSLTSNQEEVLYGATTEVKANELKYIPIVLNKELPLSTEGDLGCLKIHAFVRSTSSRRYTLESGKFLVRTDTVFQSTDNFAVPATSLQPPVSIKEEVKKSKQSKKNKDNFNPGDFMNPSFFQGFNGGVPPGFNGGGPPGFNGGVPPGLNGGGPPGFNGGGAPQGFGNGGPPGFNNMDPKMMMAAMAFQQQQQQQQQQVPQQLL